MILLINLLNKLSLWLVKILSRNIINDIHAALNWYGGYWDYQVKIYNITNNKVSVDIIFDNHQQLSLERETNIYKIVEEKVQNKYKSMNIEITLWKMKNYKIAHGIDD